MDAGQLQALGQAVINPLPPSWLLLATAPPSLPDWALIGNLSSVQVHALQSQMAYDLSNWNYKLIGTNNKLGRYQVPTTTLETYGLLVAGSNVAYGTNCVNYQHCWAPSTAPKATANTNVQYIYNTTDLSSFLSTPNAQEHLNYQILNDLYQTLTKINAITATDPPDVVAGMIYVAYQLGAGAAPSITSPTGTGAYAWRYSAQDVGAKYYNSGRYAIMVLAE